MERMRGWRARTLGSLIGTGLLLGLPVAAIANSVTLAWNPNIEPDLAGYRVYIGTSHGTYTQSIDVGHVTAYTVSGLSPGQTYFLSITAYDIFANESGYSPEVNVTIVAASTPAPASASVPPAAQTLQGTTSGLLAAPTSEPPPESAPKVVASDAPQPEPTTESTSPSTVTRSAADGGGGSSSGVFASLLDSLHNVFMGDTSSTALVSPSEGPTGTAPTTPTPTNSTNPTNPINPTGTGSAGGTAGTAAPLRSAWERGVEAERLHQEGRNLYARGKIEEAIPRLQEAVQIWVSLPPSEEAGVSAHDLAVAYYAAEHHGEAIKTYGKALTVYRQLGIRELEARVLDHMGRAYEGLGDYSSADGAYRASLEIWEALGERAEMAAVLEHRGGAQAAGGQYAAALESYRSSLTLFEEFADRDKLDELQAAIVQMEQKSVEREGSAAGAKVQAVQGVRQVQQAQ